MVSAVEEYDSLPAPLPPLSLRSQIALVLARRAQLNSVSSAALMLFLLVATSAVTEHPGFTAFAVTPRLVAVAWNWRLARTAGQSTGKHSRGWLRQFAVVTVLAGLHWGLMAAVCLAANDLGAQTALVLVATAGVLSAAVNLCVPVPAVLRLYSVALVGPIIATAALYHPGQFSKSLALTLAFYLAFIWLQGAQFHRDFLAALKSSSRLQRRARQLHRSREILRRLALYDPLTGALNRGEGVRLLERELIRARREGTRLAALLLDLDHFKHINDTYGHAGGDEVLRAVVARLQSSLRAYDVVVRYGGEEFLIVLPGCDQDKGRSVAERLRRAIAASPVESGARAIEVTASFGLSSWDGSITAEALVELADQALYQAKRAGRNSVVAAQSRGEPTWRSID